MAFFKDYAHQVAVAVGLLLIFELGQVVTWKLMRGHAFPEGYDTYIWSLITLSGVNVAGIGVLRATNPTFAAARAVGKQAGKPDVNVEGDANITTTAERRSPTGRSTDQFPVVPNLGVPAKPAFGGSSQ